MEFLRAMRIAVDSSLRAINGIGLIVYGSGLIATIQESANATAVALAGALVVIVTAGVQVYRVWRQTERDERDKTVRQAIELDTLAKQSGTSLAAIEGHVEVARVERSEIMARLDAIEKRLAYPPCLAPNTDGTPGCHGLGPDHPPVKQPNQP